MPKGLSLRVQSFAHIKRVEVPLRDLTVLVGPQATGKSLVLQLLRLAIDQQRISGSLLRHGYEWGQEKERFADLFFGLGMHASWRRSTRVALGKKIVDLEKIARGRREAGSQRLFYVPAQRTLTMPEGWPQPFTSFLPDTPFVVREFSEQLRTLMRGGLGAGPAEADLFPHPRRLKSELRNLVNDAIFHGSKLERGVREGRQQLLLRAGDTELAYMTWTAGQREFVPLLLGLYHLAPPGGTTTRKPITWAVIEEPEMGLHPQAVMAVMTLVLELLDRGYRVVVSTHSAVVLEIVWAMNVLQGLRRGAKAMCEAFGIPASGPMESFFKRILAKKRAVVYLRHQNDHVVSEDVTDLDPASENEAVRGWGGLAQFNERIGESVAWAVNAG